MPDEIDPSSDASAADSSAPVDRVLTLASSTLIGLDAHPVEVEVRIQAGAGTLEIQGLTEAAEREARVRVLSSLAGLDERLEGRSARIRIRPEGPFRSAVGLDLAIALSLLGALGRVPTEALSGVLLLGELGLDGTLRPVRGALAHVRGAWARGTTRAIVPRAHAQEVGLATDSEVWLAASLGEIVEHLSGGRPLELAPETPLCRPRRGSSVTLDDMVDLAPRVRQTIADGARARENLLLVGPPGSGKTLIARAVAGLLPALTGAEVLECTTIWGAAGLLGSERGIITEPPFRAPHYSVSEAGLLGGGDVPRPGEVTLAHGGVLLVDETPEFRLSTLDALASVLRAGRTSVVHRGRTVTFPAKPLVIGAMNPCPCGYFGHPRRSCRCSDRVRERYLERIPRTLKELFKVHVNLTAQGGESR